MALNKNLSAGNTNEITQNDENIENFELMKLAEEAYENGEFIEIDLDEL